MPHRRPLELGPLPVNTRLSRYSGSDMSLASTMRATALDVCYSVYGEATATTDDVDQLYDQNAGEFGKAIEFPDLIEFIYYENPFITASTRTVIGDIHRLSRRMSSVDVPRPLAVISTLFRLRPLDTLLDNPLFHAIQVWTDVTDISESESFDGHRKAIVEHTLHILLLPGIHCEGPTSHFTGSSSDILSVPHTPLVPTPTIPFLIPSLPIPGTSLSVPSPLHSMLRIITRLSFNELGLVTHHRDIWDVKDVMGLVPGVSLAQWIGTRISAAGLSYVSRLLPGRKTFENRQQQQNQPSKESADLEAGPSQSSQQDPSFGSLRADEV
ncbi:hypothetical protein BKA70DRAFT_1368607 [Coprinopsis sp. MPI-PUGE-AT-0042]|nr:hypothetical protein BKA70DRAFT_1368607 [Coprinopsis sp. MPI-PUGE-AT-0042]